MKIAFDTNILVYAEGLNGAEKQAVVLDLINSLASATKIVPSNVFGELFNVLKRKGRFPAQEARQLTLGWRRSVIMAESTEAAMMAAIDLATDHGLMIWDALVLAVAAVAGCRLLLSEDMQDGFTWRGVTVVNPFADPRSPLLKDALRP